VTTPDLAADRPIPDADDLRLLAELVNNAYIPLANAAWTARLSQAEAALRLVSMAERGLPLRLVADGDRQALWHIAQAGPATRGVPVTGGQAFAPSGQPAPGGPAPVPVPQSGSAPQPGFVPPSGGTPPVAAQLLTAPPLAMPGTGSGTAGSGPLLVPPASPVPPHEQAIAGAVPLGEPPFGQAAPPAAAEQGRETEHTPEPEQALASEQTPASEQTLASEPVREPEAAAEPAPSSEARPDAPAHAAPETPAAPEPSVAPQVPVAPEAEGAGSSWGPAGTSAWAGQEPAAEHLAVEHPAVEHSAATPPRWAPQSVTGPAGEQLVVSILEVADPGDQVLTDAGYRMDPGQRAVLVHSSVANTGQVPYYPVGDLYLVLETDQHVLLGRANVAVASHPAFGVGVSPGRTADGWSVFLIPSQTVLTGLKWCIRPDIPQTIVGWPISG
jgi:hypothetical protein